MEGEDLPGRREATADVAKQFARLLEPAGPTEADERQQEMRDRARSSQVEFERIRNDPTLSDEGKREALQSAYDMAKGTVDAMGWNLQEDTDKRLQKLNRSLFGLSDSAPDSAVIAFRDAQDRVVGVRTPEQLGELMEMADASGDATLLKAGFAQAWQRSQSPIASDGWAALVDEYINQHPDAADKLQEVISLSSHGGKTSQLHRRLQTTVFKPKELRNR